MFVVRCAKCHTVINAYYLMEDFKEICTCGFQVLPMDPVLSLM